MNGVIINIYLLGTRVYTPAIASEPATPFSEFSMDILYSGWEVEVTNVHVSPPSIDLYISPPLSTVPAIYTSKAEIKDTERYRMIVAALENTVTVVQVVPPSVVRATKLS